METGPDAERGGFRSLDPEHESESYTGKCKKWCFLRREVKNERTLLVSSFEPTLELTLEPELDLKPPLRLDDGLFSFSAFCSCLDVDFDLDLDFGPDLDGLLLSALTQIPTSSS